MSDTVKNSIKQAVEVLQNAFDVSLTNETEIFQYFQLENLAAIYEKEFKDRKLDLFDLGSSISKMRSTYLPVDLVRGIAEDLGVTLDEIISANTAIRESRENTFMRMLGMPQSIELFKNTNIRVINSDGNTSFLDFDTMENFILNERQAIRENRRILLDNMFFEQDEVSIYDLENNFFAYCYLLVPPVQDYRISQCINETNKIVAPNFLSNKEYIVNQEKIKISLLEAIIRIRIDRLSGRLDFSNIQVGDAEEQIDADSYGVLESLFIVRIRSALKGIAKKLIRNTDALREYNELTGRIPIINKNSEAIQSDKIEQNNDDEDVPTEKDVLRKQKIIEDAVIAILNDNTQSIDLLNSNRKSSIVDAHLISPILSIVNLPSQRINRELLKIEEIPKRKDPSSKEEGEIRLFLGTDKGIGYIDILIFILALFTLPEEYLTGLLSLEEYSRFFNEFYKISPPSISKKDTAESVDKLTEFILEGYNIFKEDLRDDISDLVDEIIEEDDLE